MEDIQAGGGTAWGLGGWLWRVCGRPWRGSGRVMGVEEEEGLEGGMEAADVPVGAAREGQGRVPTGGRPATHM